MNEKELLLHLSLINNVGPATIEKIVNTFLVNKDFNLLDVYRLTSKDLSFYTKLNDRLSTLIVKSLSNKALIENELNLLEKNKLSYITIIDKDYPVLLKHIHLPPTVLYIKGQPLPTNDRLIAVVGSRKADAYGYSIVKKIVPELVSNNWTLVSGGAIGIDTAVHKITLNSYGKTIAVLGSGLLKPYPTTNKDLFEKIAQNGSVISPFNLTASPLARNFPARNRIIAGLTKACLVVQAASSSGALITAKFALNEGREVCAVPGSIDNPLSQGCHNLISQGGYLITNANDIRLILNDTDNNSISLNKIINPTLTEEDKIVSYCVEPISFDELLIKTRLEADKLQEYLWNLQLSGCINQNFMGLWHKQ